MGIYPFCVLFQGSQEPGGVVIPIPLLQWLVVRGAPGLLSTSVDSSLVRQCAGTRHPGGAGGCVPCSTFPVACGQGGPGTSGRDSGYTQSNRKSSARRSRSPPALDTKFIYSIKFLRARTMHVFPTPSRDGLRKSSKEGERPRRIVVMRFWTSSHASVTRRHSLNLCCRVSMAAPQCKQFSPSALRMMNISFRCSILPFTSK